MVALPALGIPEVPWVQRALGAPSSHCPSSDSVTGRLHPGPEYLRGPARPRAPACCQEASGGGVGEHTRPSPQGLSEPERGEAGKTDPGVPASWQPPSLPLDARQGCGGRSETGGAPVPRVAFRNGSSGTAGGAVLGHSVSAVATAY